MRCTGHCCKNFFLPYTYQELKQAYEAWYKSELKWGSEGRELPQDIHLVYPMVIPRHNQKYDCKNLLENGDCSIYDNRPKVCREYPYENKCKREGCTA